jgi:hypothetical protein
MTSQESRVLLRVLGLTAMAAYLGALPAWAHHSHGNYQMTEYTHLEGTVKELYLVNPHAWIYLEVVGVDGEPAVWALESTGISGLTRIGVTEDTIKVGDTVSVRCHQLRDGSNGCLLGFLTTADGVEKEWD